MIRAYARFARGCGVGVLRRPELQFRLAVVALLAFALVPVHAQSRRPKAEVLETVETKPVKPGTVARVTLMVRLPQSFHVQSDKPRDPLLIPTALTIDAPKGVTVAGISYPKATDLKQEGEEQPLSVFGHEFEIAVRLSVAKTVAPGDLAVPGRLRYQPCDDTMCYPPARADVSWTLTIAR